jgi:hypothetical protein
MGFTATALAPLGWKGKLIMGVGTLALGRAANEVSHLMGWEGPDGIKLRDELRHKLDADSGVKTANSFNNGVEAALMLSRHKAGEGALDLQMADLINSQNSMKPIDYARQHALLSEATGMARLEKGSRIVEGGNNATEVYGDNARILKDQKYDFLGEATLSLCDAFSDLSTARRLAFEEKAKVNADKSLDNSLKVEKLSQLDDQMKQCDAERAKIHHTLQGIFGEHDMQAIFKELSEACRTRSSDMDRLLLKRQELFETFSSQVNPQIRAKYARDLTVGFLAEAQYRAEKGNGEEAKIMYQNALNFMAKAQALESSNPNNAKLVAIAKNISMRIPNAMKSQYDSNWNNPFQLKPPGTR